MISTLHVWPLSKLKGSSLGVSLITLRRGRGTTLSIFDRVRWLYLLWQGSWASGLRIVKRRCVPTRAHQVDPKAHLRKSSQFFLCSTDCPDFLSFMYSIEYKPARWRRPLREKRQRCSRRAGTRGTCASWGWSRGRSWGCWGCRGLWWGDIKQ